MKEEKENDVALLTRPPRRNKELRTAFSHAPLKSNKLKFFPTERCGGSLL